MQPASPSKTPRPAPPAHRLDNPGVRVPPPVVFIATYVIALLLQVQFPLPFLAGPVAVGIGAVLSAAGVLLAAAAIPTMLHGHGTLNTHAPSAALVTSGPYRLSRNPMYLALALLYSGPAFVFANVWALPLLIPLLIFLQYRVVAPEERYLERAFGDAYRTYRSHVRRWL